MASKPRIHERRQRIQDLEATGVRSPAEIARRLQVPLRTVQADIAAMNRAFQTLEEAAQLRLTTKRQQVAAAEWRNGELVTEWRRLKLNKEKERAKEATGGTGKRAGKRIETQAESEGRLGDVSYLREMRENDKYVAGLLGLLVDKHEHTGKDGKELPDCWNHGLTLQVFMLLDAREAELKAAAAAKAGKTVPETPESGLEDCTTVENGSRNHDP